MVPRGVYRPGVLRGAVSRLGALSSGVALRPGCGIGLVVPGISASTVLKRSVAYVSLIRTEFLRYG